MGSTRHVTALTAALILAAAGGGLRADDTASNLDREVVIVGEDRMTLHAPEPARWAAVEIPDLDLHLPAAERDRPLAPPLPPWSAPAPVQVIALMEAPDA
jgi:hypothetical protein